MSPCNHFGRAACAAAVCMLGSVASAQDANGLLQAMIPLEMLPVDPALATGGLWVRGRCGRSRASRYSPHERRVPWSSKLVTATRSRMC